MTNLRITEHPILDIPADTKQVHVYFEGKELLAREGETVASALTSYGIRAFRTTRKRHEPRGVFCAIGRCTDCMMTKKKKKNVRTCMTEVKEGMQIERG